jgi:hypothetical protein
MRTVSHSGKHLSEMDQMSVNQIELILQHSQEPDGKTILVKDSIKESIHATAISILQKLPARIRTTENSILQVSSEVHLPF